MVNYLDMGKGSVILFLHGWGAPAEIYTPILKHLAEKHRVLAPDLPGFGGTSEPDRPWNTDDYVNFAQYFLKEKGVTECTLIGHSHGGRMILNWLSRDKQPVRVKQAVLCGAAGLKPPRGPDYYIKVYSYKTAKVLLKPFPKLLEKLRSNAGSADFKSASPIMKATLSQVVNEDYKPFLGKIHQPTLLVWGDMDTASPLSHGQTMEKLIPDAGLVVLKGGTHFAILEQPALFLRVIDAFVKE